MNTEYFTARIAELESQVADLERQLAMARGDALEEAATMCDGFLHIYKFTSDKIRSLKGKPDA